MIFLASIAGVFKPYISRSRRSHFFIASLVSFVLIAIAAPKVPPPDTPTRVASVPEIATAATTDVVPAGPTAEAAAAKWEYSDSKDEMRDTVTRFAAVRSDNEVDLDFPYGSVSGTITLRSRPKDGLNVMFSVDKGQILCSSFSDSYVSVKFDGKAIQKFSCTTSSDGSSETAFIVNERRFLSQLRSAKKTVVEAEFYQKGNQQFVFQTAGLNWS